MNDTMVLLGAPGVGKSTFSYRFKQRVPNIKQFSVRLFTQQLLEGDTELGRYLRDNQIVRPKAYMPDEVVERIFSAFMDTVPREAFLLIEGFPINQAQFYGMTRQLSRRGRSLKGVFVLEDDLSAIQKRQESRKICPACELKNGAGLPVPAGLDACPYCGGPLRRRPEDDPSFFRNRCEKFEEELRFITQQLPDRIHRIDVSRQDPVEAVIKWMAAGPLE